MTINEPATYNGKPLADLTEREAKLALAETLAELRNLQEAIVEEEVDLVTVH